MICHLSPNALHICSWEVSETCDCYCSERGDGGESSWQEQVSGNPKRMYGALENIWEQTLLFTIVHKVGKGESDRAYWTSFVYLIKASGTDFHMSRGETPATFPVCMESWLPFSFIWHDVLSIGAAFPEEQNSNSRAHILCDLCIDTKCGKACAEFQQQVHVFPPHYAVSRECIKIQHGSTKALLYCTTAVPKSLHASAFLCNCWWKYTASCHSVLCLKKGSAPKITGLQTFLGILELALFWDGVFLIKVRKWSHDQNRMESYFKVCSGHPMWGHLYMQNREKAGIQKRLDPEFGFTLVFDLRTASLIYDGR